MTTIAENLKQIHEEIGSACAKAGRNPAEVKLIAVSKTKPASAILEACEAGQVLFGENYVQEFLQKHEDPLLSGCNPEWHFIGHLQSNKIRYIVGKVAMVQTIDKFSTAEELSKRAGQLGITVPILLEVNISGEESKHGIRPDSLFTEAERIAGLSNLELRGLMTIASPDPDVVRGEYREMRRLIEKLRQESSTPQHITELSMGMSQDFEIAIEEGATMIRVGTAIFGDR
jgi:PLP dependent protein